MCDIDTDSYSESWSESEVKARKPHRCDCCGGPILPGQKYTKHFSKFEGEITSEKCCAECFIDRSEFSKAHEYWTPSPGCTKDMVDECLRERESLPMMLKWARTLKRMEKRKQAAAA